MSKYTNTLTKAMAKLEKNEENLKKRLSYLYDHEAAKLEKDIAAYYQKYGHDDVIEYRTMMQQLSKEEATLLYENMDQFFRLHPERADLRPVRESIYKLNRLEGLQLSIKMQQLDISTIDTYMIGNHLIATVDSTYESVKALIPFTQYDWRAATQIGSELIKDSDFGKRMQANHEQLANYLNTDIAKGIARGDNYDKLNRQIRSRFDNVSRRSAYRLLYTEGTRMFNRANSAAFEEVGIKQYEYCTSGDERVCPDCDALEGNKYNLDEASEGTNYPPMHPWCRCYTVPAVDWNKWLDDRIAARDYTAEQQEEAAEFIKNFTED